VVDVAREVDVVGDDNDDVDGGGNSDTEEKPLQIGMISKFVRKPFKQHRVKRYDICFVNTIVNFVVDLYK